MPSLVHNFWTSLRRAIPVSIAEHDYDDGALMAARNKLVAVHLAILGLAETVAGHEDEILCVERVLDEAVRDLNCGMKRSAEPSPGAGAYPHA
jgi:hypothetical protein